MYIKFKNIKIENFQALKTANIELDSQGTVQIKGVNLYENNADSNGSGKSSCFEALVWAIYGKTSVGITDVVNKFNGKNDCSVTLEFEIDNNAYKIVRTNKTVDFICNDNVITNKNKTDTNKSILSVIPFDMDVFLSTIYLSQGFNARLSTLTPSGRKERIETLTGISNRIDEFKEKVSNIKSKLNGYISVLENKISYNRGVRETLQNSLDTQQAKLNDLSTKITDIDVINKYKSDLSEVTEKLDKQQAEIQNFEKYLYDYKLSKSSAQSKVTNIKSTIEQNLQMLSKLEVHKCPTCDAILDEEKTQNLKSTYENTIIDSKTVLKEELDNIDVLDKKIAYVEGEIQKIKESVNALKLDKQTISDKLSNCVVIDSTNDILQDISNYKTKIYDLDTEIGKDEQKLNNLKDDVMVASQMLQLITKQFRTYMLENIISFINNKLKEYSSYMFSNPNDLIQINTDSNKLNISVGNTFYESLSGGEKRKVDLAITFVQRDLLLEIVGISTNIIVLDEVMDYMDSTATSRALDMISNIALSISSMFIISHNDYEIPYDKTMVITKGLDRCSSIDII